MRVTRFLWRAAIMVFMIWSVGTFTVFGFHGFAMAQDVEKKIAEALAPVQAQLEEIKTKELKEIKSELEDNKRIQRRILIAQLSSQLRDLNRLKCNLTDHEAHQRLESDIDTAQQEYRALTGEWYPLSKCRDL